MYKIKHCVYIGGGPHMIWSFSDLFVSEDNFKLREKSKTRLRPMAFTYCIIIAITVLFCRGLDKWTIQFRKKRVID